LVMLAVGIHGLCNRSDRQRLRCLTDDITHALQLALVALMQSGDTGIEISDRVFMSAERETNAFDLSDLVQRFAVVAQPGVMRDALRCLMRCRPAQDVIGADQYIPDLDADL